MRSLHAAVLIILCGGFFGLGLLAARSPASASPTQAASPTSTWRSDLDALRGTAEGTALRAAALEAIASAPSQDALAESVELLGWVGDERDIRLVVGILHDENVQEACITALGRLVAVDALLELSEHPLYRGEALVGLGLTGSEDALPILEEALNSPALHASAVAGLTLHGSDTAQKLLIDALDEAEWWQVSGIADALASFPPASAAHAMLHEQLRHGDVVRRTAAMSALAKVKDPALYEILLEAVVEGSPTARTAAIEALGLLDDPRAIPVLVAVAEGGRSSEVEAAIRSLDWLTEPAAEEALCQLVETANEEVAALAVATLDPAEHPESLETLLWALDNRGSAAREASLQILFRTPWTECPPEVLALALQELEQPTPNFFSGHAWSLVLHYGSTDEWERVEEVLLHGDRSVALWGLTYQTKLLPNELLLKLLDDADPQVRSAAISALEQRGDAVVGQLELALIERLDDRARPGWDNVEATLARIGGPRAIAALMDRVTRGTGQESSRALSALVSAGDPSHLDALHHLYERSDDPKLRERILEATLWNNPHSEAFAYAALEKEEDARVRADAARALASSGTPKALATLEGLLEDEDPELRAAALGALARQPGMRPRLIASLDDPDLAGVALDTLARDTNPEAREAIERFALNPNADTLLRVNAISGMGWNGGDPGSLSTLLQDENPQVQSAALGALETGGSTESAEYIAELLEDDEEIASQAAWSLKRMGGRVYEENAEQIDALTDASQPSWPGVYFQGHPTVIDEEVEIEEDEEPVEDDEESELLLDDSGFLPD